MESAGDGLAPAGPPRAEHSRAGEPEPEMVRESLEGAQAQVRHLLVAMEHRTVTGQATGIVMERFGLTAQEAFVVLARLSQEQNVKLYVLAQRLTETGEIPGLRAPQ